MPLYNYICNDCGPFEEWVPMANAANPCSCPSCQAPSGREIAAPQLSLMNGSLRQAMARSEKSGTEPRVVKKKHLAGCGCSICNVGKKAPSPRRKWMIGHC